MKDLKDAALVIFGHGSSKNDQSSAPVYQHAATLRERGVFGQVVEAFWKQEPKLIDVLAQVPQARIFLVPLFVSEGFFSESVIPESLGYQPLQETSKWRIKQADSKKLYYCRAAGSAPQVDDIILQRADGVLRDFPFPRRPANSAVSLFLAGHGTPQDANSRKAIETPAERIRNRNIFGEVHTVYIEEEPRISACYEMATFRNIVLVPCFISDGMHVAEDLPILLGEPEGQVRERLAGGRPTWRNPTERKGKLVWCSPSIGTAPAMAELVLLRVREALQFEVES